MDNSLINKMTAGKIKIAVASNDGLHIFAGMLGRARRFYIYERIGRGDINLLEIRNNPYTSSNQHLKTLDVYELLRDCPVILSASIGQRGIERLERRGVELLFHKGRIGEALKQLTAEIEEIRQRRKGV